MKTLAVTILPLFILTNLQAQETRTTTTTTKTTWNGTLVDAACQNTRTTRTESTPAKTETTRTETTECPVTSSTSSFGLLTADGRFIRFDNPSNTRVVQIVKSNEALSKSMSSKSPVRVSVVGTASGDVAIVETLNPQEGSTTTYAERTEPGDVTLDARYGDDRGKLVVSERGLRYENVSNASRSRSWNYSQIKELHRTDNNKVKIQPYSGDDWEFRFDGPAMSDSVYKMIADRIVAARGK
jgi:hypothetical protein